MKEAPLRRLVFVLIWLTALAPPFGAVGYFLYETLLAPRAAVRIIGPYDGFYWDAAQFQIAYARLENQVLLYQNGTDRDDTSLTLRYEILQSKLGVIRGSTNLLGEHPTLERSQRDELTALDEAIRAIGPGIEALPTDASRGAEVVAILNAHWEQVNDLAQNRRRVDVEERDALTSDFVAKRRYLFAGGIVLLLLSAAATMLLIFNGMRRSKLIAQQHAALAAEHEAARVAREASLAKDTFLGMISHEVRTPLHAIVSSVELLGLNPQSEANSKVIRRLETAARHLEVQMRDLTDYARLGAGKLVLHDERFDPRALVESVVEENLQAASAKQLVLTSAAAGGAGLVESDPHRIRQIVTNLVTNAIRYTDAGSVHVALEVGAGALAISVSDTGPGVEAAQIPLLFKEFTQLDSSRTRRFDGAGMGLAIVQGLVDLFGGAITVASRVGEGTTFSVTIPVRSVEPAAQQCAAPEEGGRVARPCVLVVDDNPLVRESLGELLAHMDCEVATTAGADEALRWLEANRCDLVLVDLHMPGKDGYTLVAELRAGGGPNAAVPVIAVSAYAPEPGAAGEPGPFCATLAKPVHYDQLRDAVERARVMVREA